LRWKSQNEAENQSMKLSKELRRKVLYAELDAFLRTVDAETKQEVPFSKIFPTNRQFRADFYCPRLRIIIEVNGGQFIGGRHNRGGGGYETDLTKLNLAQSHGIRVFQYTYEMLEKRQYIESIRRIYENR